MQPNVLKDFVSKDIYNVIGPYLEQNAWEHPVDFSHPYGKKHLMVFNNGRSAFFDYPPRFLEKDQKIVFDVINLIQQAAASQFNLPKDQIKIKGLEYTIQEIGQSLTMHTDAGVSKNNVYSAILYLTDNYEGGEVVFYDTHLQEEPIPTRYKPEAGTLVYFPGTVDYPHEVLPVLSGSRAAFVMFFEGIDPKA